MKDLLVKIILIFFLNISCSNSQSRENVFWNWIIENQEELTSFIKSDSKDYSIYNELTEKLKTYHPILYPEMTLTDNNEVVLIITPDGLSDGIFATEKLYDSKPIIKNWKIFKFRQAKDEIQLNVNGVEFPTSDIIIIPEIDLSRNKINIELYIKNMNSNIEGHQHLAFLYLDHILGEYNTIKKVGYIDFYDLSKKESTENGISILELRHLIERELK